MRIRCQDLDSVEGSETRGRQVGEFANPGADVVKTRHISSFDITCIHSPENVVGDLLRPRARRSPRRTVGHSLRSPPPTDRGCSRCRTSASSYNRSRTAAGSSDASLDKEINRWTADARRASTILGTLAGKRTKVPLARNLDRRTSCSMDSPQKC